MDGAGVLNHPFTLTMVSLFTFFALLVVGQFFRMRQSYFLKQRCPRMALAQLILSMLYWTISTLFINIIPEQDLDSSECVPLLANNLGIIRGQMLVSIFQVLCWRIWRLYWRQFLSRHLSAQRQRIKKNVNDASNVDTTDSRTVCWRFRLAKYGVPSFFAVAVCVQAIALIFGVAWGSCTIFEDRAFHQLTLQLYIFLGVFLMVMGWLVRKFSDNFHFAQEFKLYGTASFVMAVVYVSTFGVEDEILVAELLILFTCLFLMALFVFGGFIPIYLQWRLDRKIADDNFTHFEQFEALFEDTAALESFRIFARREYCEELLEFYESVAQYKRMFHLRTPEAQRSAATVIYMSFIAVDAPSQINISAQRSAQIRAALFEDSREPQQQSSIVTALVCENTFDDAQREIFKLTKTGLFVRYVLNQNAKTKPSEDRDIVVPVDA